MEDTWNKNLQLIRRATYRMKVKQAGGKFIQVKEWNDILKERKAEYDMYIYNRDNGYSGFDEDHNERGIYDHE